VVKLIADTKNSMVLTLLTRRQEEQRGDNPSEECQDHLVNNSSASENLRDLIVL
jgi:hypothetical protein